MIPVAMLTLPIKMVPERAWEVYMGWELAERGDEESSHQAGRSEYSRDARVLTSMQMDFWKNKGLRASEEESHSLTRHKGKQELEPRYDLVPNNQGATFKM